MPLFRRLLALFLPASALALGPAAAQSRAPLLVNGVAFAETGCQQRAELRTVAVPPLARDSVVVELVVVRGRRQVGAKVFASIAAFNAFHLGAWQAPAAGSGPASPSAPTGLLDYPPPLGLQDGDRLCILIGKLGKGKELTDEGSATYRVYNVPLCTAPE